MSTAMIKNVLQRIPTIDRFARHLKYYERQQRLLEAHETKGALIEHRKRILDAQNRLNYLNEFNRLVGALTVNGHRGETPESRRQKRVRMLDLMKYGGASLEAGNRINPSTI